MSYKERERSRSIRTMKQNKRAMPMYYHLPINIRSIGDCQAAECALCARCSDVAGAAWTNITAFTSFSVLYLCVSNNLLTHTSEVY